MRLVQGNSVCIAALVQPVVIKYLLNRELPQNEDDNLNIKKSSFKKSNFRFRKLYFLPFNKFSSYPK